MWTKKARNMSYVRFQNTLEALKDCYNAMTDEPDEKLDADEEQAKKWLIETCQEIASEFSDIEEEEKEIKEDLKPHTSEEGRAPKTNFDDEK